MKKFFYRVESNDTVFSLSKKFGVPPVKLIKDNRLGEEIVEGDLLYVEKEDAHLYAVKPFDTALSLAKKFNTTEREILDDNGVEYLFYGLVIQIKKN